MARFFQYLPRFSMLLIKMCQVLRHLKCPNFELFNCICSILNLKIFKLMIENMQLKSSKFGHFMFLTVHKKFGEENSVKKTENRKLKI